MIHFLKSGFLFTINTHWVSRDRIEMNGIPMNSVSWHSMSFESGCTHTNLNSWTLSKTSWIHREISLFFLNSQKLSEVNVNSHEFTVRDVLRDGFQKFFLMMTPTPFTDSRIFLIQVQDSNLYFHLLFSRIRLNQSN